MKHKHSLQETKNTAPLTGLSARVVLAQEIANGLMNQNMLDVPVFVAMNVIARILESSPEYNNKEWRTVIIGLPIIRKLLNGEDVTLEEFKVNFLPDDVLFNNKPRQ